MAADLEVVVGNLAAQHVLIRPLFRSYPQSQDYWDGNWIESEIEVAVGGFRGGFRACLRSEEFEQFRESLQTLYDTVRGSAEFATMEQQLAVALTGDGKGHVTVTGKALDEASSANVLKFEFEIDQTYLVSVIHSLEGVLERFPVLGKADAQHNAAPDARRR